jgi:uncharacterized protein YqgC (DUF456 family)
MPELLWLLAAVCVVAGVVGTVLPVLPGAPLVWLGLLLAAWADGFARVSGWTLALLAVLAATALAVDLAAAAVGAKRVGASRSAIVGAAIGTVVGFAFGLPGLVLGPFLGAVAGEYLVGRSWRTASKVGVGTSIGMLLGLAAKVAVTFTMLGVFALAYLF